MQFLILAHSDDDTAIRVYKTLCVQHGADQVKLVSSEELALAPHWSHCLEDAGITTRLRLSDDSTLDSASLGVVFNRLRYVPTLHFGGATEQNKHYAVMETFALWLSWLTSLPCTVINQPMPRGLGYQTRSHVEWLFLACKVGLPTQGYHFTTNNRRFPKDKEHWLRQTPIQDDFSGIPISRQPTLYVEPLTEARQSILIAGQKSIGSLVGQYTEPIQRLKALTQCELLEVTFAKTASTDGDWKVCDINSFPEVQEIEGIYLIAELLNAKRTNARFGNDSIMRYSF
jgi:hypothetical protein